MAAKLTRRGLVVALLSAPSIGVAAERRAFRARLSTMPLTVAMQSTVAGEGQASAALEGARLTITGEFWGLKSKATTGEVRIAPPGLRGAQIAALEILPEGDGLRGRIGGAFELSAQQLADLSSGRLYLQLSSEKAPEGNLRGWLEPVESRR